MGKHVGLLCRVEKIKRREGAVGKMTQPEIPQQQQWYQS
jgi:non-canonical (house-cleaning) NTP pyrophosphatase